MSFFFKIWSVYTSCFNEGTTQQSQVPPLGAASWVWAEAPKLLWDPGQGSLSCASVFSLTDWTWREYLEIWWGLKPHHGSTLNSTTHMLTLRNCQLLAFKAPSLPSIFLIGRSHGPVLFLFFYLLPFFFSFNLTIVPSLFKETDQFQLVWSEACKKFSPRTLPKILFSYVPPKSQFNILN